MRYLKYIILFFCLFTHAANKENYQNSVQWQKLNLEAYLKDRVDGFVELMVDEKQVYSEVNVTIKQQPFNVPNFKFPKKKVAKSGIKSLSEKSSFGEMILFDKIGLRAPVISNIDADEEDNRKLQIKFYQYKKRIENEMNKSFDLFSKIESVSIKLVFDDEVDEKKVSRVKNNLEKILPVIGNTKIKVETLSLPFSKAIKPSPKAMIFKNLPYLTGPVGLILATLILCLSSFLIFNGYKKLKSNIAEKEAAIMTSTASGNSSTSVSGSDTSSSVNSSVTSGGFDPNIRPGSPQLMDAISSQDDGVQRMLIYLEKANEDACSLIRKWISFDSILSSAALVVLSERLSVDELYQIFAKLSLIEREQWMKIINRNEITQDIKIQADSYIGQEVLEAIMNITGTTDEELNKLLVDLSPQKAAEVASKNTLNGAVLVNILSSSFLSEMYNYLENDKIIEISSKGLEMTDEMLEKNKIILIQSINLVKETKYKNAFSRRISEVMNALNPLKQEDLINVLIQEQQIFIIRDVVRNIIPARIIDQLPSDIIKKATKNLSREERVEYLLTLSGEKQLTLLDSIASEGTKGREALEFEITKMRDNEEKMQGIEKRKDEIYESFIINVRNSIKSDKALFFAIKSIVDEWLDSIDNNDNKNIQTIAS